MRESPARFSVRRIAHNTAWLLAGRIFSGAAYLATMTLLARYLGVSEYGKLIFAVTYITFFCNISIFGIDSVLIREISRKPDQAGDMISCGITLKLILSIIAISLAYVLLNFFNDGRGVRQITIILLITLLYSGLRTPKVIFEARLESFLTVIIEIVARGCTLFGIIIAIWLDLGLVAAALTLVIAEIPSLWLLFSIASRKISIQFKLSVSTAKFLLRESWQLGLMAILISIYFRADTLMLSFLIGDSAVGFYNAAYIILTSIMIIPDAYVRSIFPALSKAYNENRRLLSATFSDSLKYLFTAGLLVVLIGVAFSEPIITYMYGDAYLPASSALKVLFFASGVLFISPLVSASLTAINRQKTNLYISIINVGLNLSLNLLFIPRWSFVGASVATLITEAVGCGLALLATARFLNIRISAGSLMRDARILAPISLSILIFYLFRDTHFVLAAFVVTVAYCSALFLVRWFNVDDISRMKRMIRGKL
jgi:O-antigen/teichoic acid export membrane protein